jgi:uncharacterized alkaline shock family protein YloU
VVDTAGVRPATQPDGTIEVADSAIVSVVQAAARSCEGVVDLAPLSLISISVAGKRFGWTNPNRGIAIAIAGGRISVALSIVVEYGRPVFTVAENVMKAVTVQVERTLGMPVGRVDVNVAGLRASDDSVSAGRAERRS